MKHKSFNNDYSFLSVFSNGSSPPPAPIIYKSILWHHHSFAWEEQYSEPGICFRYNLLQYTYDTCKKICLRLSSRYSFFQDTYKRYNIAVCVCGRTIGDVENSHLFYRGLVYLVKTMVSKTIDWGSKP